MLEDIPNTRQFCHHCGKVMKVTPLFQTTVARHDKTTGEDVMIYTTHAISQCVNCDNITHHIYHQDDYEPKSRIDEDGVEEWYLPVRVIGHFPHSVLPSSLKEEEKSKCIPQTILSLLKEGYIASQSGSFILATVSLRMIIDAICDEAEKLRKIKKARREELVSAGLIDKKSFDIITLIYNNANAAAHEFKSLSEEQFSSALNIVLHLLDAIYIVPQNAQIIPVLSTSKRTKKKPQIKKRQA